MESGWGARIERKLQEQYLAVQLEKNSGMSKEDTKKLIITNYLNTINLGNNTLGVKVAAKRYFNKDVSDLTLSECTVLASITKNPSRLNPISDAKTMRNAGESYSSICMSRVISPRPSRRKPWPMMYTTGYRTWIQLPRD